jgi:hypothetical protein
LMFFVSSFSAVISMQDVIDAFIDYDGPGGALEFYGALHTLNHTWTQWMPAVEDSVQVILGDALLVSLVSCPSSSSVLDLESDIQMLRLIWSGMACHCFTLPGVDGINWCVLHCV